MLKFRRRLQHHQWNLICLKDHRPFHQQGKTNGRNCYCPDLTSPTTTALRVSTFILRLPFNMQAVWIRITGISYTYGDTYSRIIYYKGNITPTIYILVMLSRDHYNVITYVLFLCIHLDSCLAWLLTITISTLFPI